MLLLWGVAGLREEAGCRTMAWLLGALICGARMRTREGHSDLLHKAPHATVVEPTVSNSMQALRGHRLPRPAVSGTQSVALRVAGASCRHNRGKAVASASAAAGA